MKLDKIHFYALFKTLETQQLQKIKKRKDKLRNLYL